MGSNPTLSAIKFMKLEGEKVTEEKDKELRERLQLVLAIAEKVKAEGGRSLIVGGFVRDERLGLPSKYIDLEG